MYTIKPMEREEALETSTWKYDGIYEFYDFSGTEEEVERMLRGNYYSVKDQDGVLIGYYCFGEPAQVPTGHKYGAYDDTTCLDIDLGMKHRLTGGGRGVEFVSSGVEFARKKLSASKIRLTVAVFNQRAIKAYEKAGFKQGLTFERTRRRDGRVIQFVIMNLE